MVVGWRGWSDWCFACFIYRHAKKLTHIGSLCSRSMSQQRLNLNISINVSLDIIWIAEPFVTKPSMVIYHYKPECHVQKMGHCLQGQGHSNWVWVHTMKSWLFLLYVLNCWFFGDQLSLTVHVHKLECLVKRLFAVFKVMFIVKVLNFSECLLGQYLSSIKLSMVMHHHQPEYHTEISFRSVQGQRHNRFY